MLKRIDLLQFGSKFAMVQFHADFELLTTSGMLDMFIRTGIVFKHSYLFFSASVTGRRFLWDATFSAMDIWWSFAVSYTTNPSIFVDNTLSIRSQTFRAWFKTSKLNLPSFSNCSFHHTSASGQSKFKYRTSYISSISSLFANPWNTYNIACSS